MNVIRGLRCIGPTHKMFFVSVLSSSLLTFYLIFDFVPEIFFGVLVSSTTIIIGYIFLSKYAAFPKKWPTGEIILLIFAFITVFHLPCHYIATSRITIRKPLNDDALIKIDKFLLGWAFQDGQISIYLDKNNFIGPHTILGRFFNNSLQIFYFFYYIIPYVTMHFMSLANCGKEIIFRYQNKGKLSPSHKRHWNNTLFLFGVYLLACFFIFFVNTLVPASSPRKHLKEKYIHSLGLTGFANYLNKKCKDDRSANSFPSGHVAEVLSIGFAYMGMGKYLISFIIIIFALLIGLATIFLRYHYFCDILMAIFLSYLSYLINYHLGYKHYLKREKERLKNNSVISINNEGIQPSVVNLQGHMNLAEEVENKEKEIK